MSLGEIKKMKNEKKCSCKKCNNNLKIEIKKEIGKIKTFWRKFKRTFLPTQKAKNAFNAIIIFFASMWFISYYSYHLIYYSYDHNLFDLVVTLCVVLGVFIYKYLITKRQVDDINKDIAQLKKKIK